MTKEIATVCYGKGSFITRKASYFILGPINFDNMSRDGHRDKWAKGDWTDDTGIVNFTIHRIILIISYRSIMLYFE